MIKNLFTFLFFLLLFGFQIHGINTRYIVIFLECVLLCIVPSGLYYLRKTLLDKFVFYITVIFLFFNFILPLIPSILHFTFDTSLIIETIGVTVSFIGVILTLALCRAYNIDLEGLKQITFNVFVIQSVIILACFMSPAFHELIKQFQFQNIVEISERYLNSGVIRGLALAGDLYFGLTSVFGLFFFSFSTSSK